jgi:hypothetical protein
VARNLAFFIALLATAVALGAAAAHALELPNKVNLPANEYFIVQKAYRGWDRLALLLLIELLAMIAVASLYWSTPAVRWAVLAAIACLASAQLVFWTFTYPANLATKNWTLVPDDWQQLRRNWEYSHAAGALFQLLAMTAMIVAVLSRRPAG